MDVMDAGVWVSKWEAKVPKHAKVTLWGPLQAREMGLDGWEVQDGGETGFVMHNPGVALTMGRATSTLIFVRRLERAFLTVYFGGYPADAPEGQRKLDMQGAVSACELFLSRLAKEPVRFRFLGEMTLVDNANDARVVEAGQADGRRTGRLLGGGARRGKTPIIDADADRIPPGVAGGRDAPTHPAMAAGSEGEGEGDPDDPLRRAGIGKVGDRKRPPTRVWEV